MKVEKVVRCKGTWEEITDVAKVLDKLGYDWVRYSKTDIDNTKYWVLEVECNDLMVKW